MHHGFSINQTKYCKTSFLALPCLSCLLFNRPVVAKTSWLHLKSQQTDDYYRIAPELAKPNLLSVVVVSIKYRWREKSLPQENFDLTINFDLMINFDFFWLNNLGFPLAMIMKFGLWTFHELSNGRKIFTLLTFDCPSNDYSDFCVWVARQCYVITIIDKAT